MAFNERKLAVVAYANGSTLWFYKTKDSLRTVKAEGYFNDAHGLVKPGDWLMTNAGQRGAMLLVSQINDGNVAVRTLES